jgi:hypothetical protein
VPEVRPNTIGWGLWILKDLLFIRDVADTSITVEDKRRDYMVLVKEVLVVGGEDKADEGQLRSCMEDLTRKHMGSNAALYGRLTYILLVAFTGRKMSVYTMLVEGSRGDLRILVEPFDVSA